MVYLCYATLACATRWMPYLGVGNVEKAMPLEGNGDTATAVGLTVSAAHHPM